MKNLYQKPTATELQQMEKWQAVNEAEKGLIGALLINGSYEPESLDEVKQLVTSEDFRSSMCRRIYEAILQTPHYDQVSVARKMYEKKTLEPNDCSEMSLLISRCPCSLDYLEYAKAVAQYSAERNPNRKPPKFNYKGLKVAK